MAREYECAVFLSHSSEGKPAVRKSAERLNWDGLRIRLDEWLIQPGDSIPPAIAQGWNARRRWSQS